VLIWRGISTDKMDTILKEASIEEEDVYSHPNAPWLEPMCRLILKAVADQKIAFSNSFGIPNWMCNSLEDLRGCF
jgi:hypothetical protein